MSLSTANPMQGSNRLHEVGCVRSVVGGDERTGRLRNIFQAKNFEKKGPLESGR